MGKLIDELRSTGHLPLYTPLKQGTLIDKGSNALGALTITGSPTWTDTNKGTGLYVPNAGTNHLSAGNPASLQLTNGTIFAAAARTESNVANYQTIIAKYNAYGLWLSNAGELKSFGCVDFGAGAFRASTWSEGPTGLFHLFAMSFQSGVVNGSSFFVDGKFCGSATITILNQLDPMLIGWGSVAGRGYGGSILFSGVSDLVLTGGQHAQLYDEWLQEGYSKNLSRKSFVYNYNAKNASEYAAQGIFLDTDFQRTSDGKVRDLTGNYPGIILAGVPFPETDNGLKFTQTDLVDFGNVTQLNSVASFTLKTWITWSSALVGARYLWNKYSAVNNHIYLYTPAAGATSTLQIGLGNGGNTYSVTSDFVVRANTKQHIAIVFNGAGATDADRLKIYVDGDSYPLIVVNAPIPAITGNSAAVNLLLGVAGGNTVPHTSMTARLNTTSETAAQIRAEYITTGAKKLTLKQTLEDVPASLAPATIEGQYIGPWMVFGDNWDCREDATTGVRSLYHLGVGHGALSIPSTDAFGTWYFKMKVGLASVQEQYVLFISSLPGRYNAVAGQSGYMIYLNADRVYLFRMDGGGSVPVGSGAIALIIPNTEYEVCVNRRPSDCRFTVWMRGGPIGAIWTQVIQVADATHTTSKYINLGSVLRQDSFPMYDPNNKNVGFFHWQGQLDPTANELF